MIIESLRVKEGAFTLLELLIVVAIVGILVGAIRPLISNTKRDARNAVTKHNLDVIRQAIYLHRSNYGEWPNLSQVTSEGCSGYDGNLPHIMIEGKIPDNPWAFIAAHVADGTEDCANACFGISRGVIGVGPNMQGWRYDPENGVIWANTAENDGTPSQGGENCISSPTTENCY